MNRLAIHLPMSAFLLGLALACGGEPAATEDPAAVPTAPPAAEAPAPAPEPMPAPAPAPEPEPTAEELPVPEDYLTEAETTIDAKNYKAALASLDKELQAEAKEP